MKKGFREEMNEALWGDKLRLFWVWINRQTDRQTEKIKKRGSLTPTGYTDRKKVNSEKEKER